MRYISLLALSVGMAAVCEVQAAEVKNIQITGLQRVEPETVRAYLDIESGQNIGQFDIDAALKRLYATGLFSDVSLDMLANGELLVKVTENPIINKRYFEGNDELGDEMLSKELQLSAGSIYSVSKVQQDAQRIVEIYKRAGRYATTVDPKIIKRDQNRVDLVYEITEGADAKIDKINFVGNTHFSDSELQSEIMSKESRWYRIFSSSENYDPEKTNYDKELLRRFYMRHGYADFRVSTAVGELSADKKSFVLTYVLDEGPRYKVKDINIAPSVRGVNVETLYPEVLFEKGDWYDADKVEKTVYAITEKLEQQGVAFVDVTSRLNKNTQTGDVDVTFDISEGSRLFIDKINIMGNTRTDDNVIRREFRIDEGDAFNASKIKASRRNIEALDYFSKVDITTEPTDDSNKADLNVKVEEKSTGSFNVGVGYSTLNGALARVGVVENNFRGKGQKLSAEAAISQRTSEYELSFTEPYFLDRRLSAGVDVFHSKTDYQDEASYDSETTGGRLRFGWNYTDDLAQYVRYTLSEDKITNVDKTASRYIKEEEGSYTNSAIGQTLVYDKRDSKIRPRDGYYLSFGNDVAGLGGDEKYVKFNAKAYKYYTISDDYTFKFFINGGYIDGYGGKNVRLSHRYYLGGSTMRGFEYAGIGARDKYTKDALGGNWMVYSGAEFQFPLGLDELGIRGRTFVDAGALGKPDHMDKKYVEYSDKIRVSTGVGLEWQSPMGQIDIDLAVPVVKEKYDETEVFRLNFGTRL